MPEFKARLMCLSELDQEDTDAWIEKTGLFLSDKNKFFEIQFFTVPKILRHFYCFDGSLTVSRIDDAGVSFYLVDVPYTVPETTGKPIATSDKADGVVFCPMSNVVCINDFGSVYIDVREVATKTFKTAAEAAGWLRRPHPMLDGKTPEQVAQTSEGKTRVHEILTAIKHGGAV